MGSASVCRFCATGRTTCFSKQKKEAPWGLCRTRMFVISGAISQWTLPQDGQHVCTTKNIHALGVYAGRVFFCHSWRNFALDSATGRRTCFYELKDSCPRGLCRTRIFLSFQRLAFLRLSETDAEAKR